MALFPGLRSPFTDVIGCVVNHQQYDKCGEFELNAVECIEAYGARRAETKCADLIKDFAECQSMKKQMMRVLTMRWERQKQLFKGERKWSEQYAEAPKPDSY